MYRYDDYDRALVKARVDQFRDQTARWQAGELADEEFRPLRLQNGLYMQRHAPMLRIAVPYGMISSAQLRVLGAIAREEDKGYAHFTTRHNLQYNWIPMDRVPDVLARLAEVEMHAIQTSGNCIRNTTTDQFAGIAPDEVVDTRPLAEIIRQWSTFHPEFAFLPRKFKIAVHGAERDRAVVQVHDIGLHLYRDDKGAVLARVWVGGGLGRTPILGEVINEALPWRHLLSYMEAIIRVYNLEGRRDNPYKARIKILVKALGIEEFRRKVDAEWANLKDGPATITDAELARVSAYFTAPAYAQLPDNDAGYEARIASDKAFARWVQQNVHAHRVPGYRAVTLSLKQKGFAPGDITDVQMDAVADLADAYSFGELRSSHEQNLVLSDVELRKLPELFDQAKALKVASSTVGLLTDIICCPGGDFCDLANAKSIPIAKAIMERFDDLDYLHDIGELDLNISGCMNACGHHHVGHIGVLGVDKNDEEWYQVTIGGRQGNDTRLGKVIGPSFAAADMPDVVTKLLETYVSLREPEERFVDTVVRVGLDPFKVSVYGDKANKKKEANNG
ncbi:MAG: sulfite reductase [Pseudomonadota bacterium]|jgi:sulfite reductase (NADPH) hemoprotein beta-component